ncbi:MAG: nitroreductase family deazaflavin-dependent oxidoreductase [Chloroflexi bacterium]|nr:nitroreductase family deazaflavin-dependent oxidoreductase [Chloroflexota bacterium]MCI0779243.1 nitroreductase family deazaflavin-dependent oxidoreductase [Chloroflexota bacterium]
MNDRIRLALDSDRLVDITTTGRNTGKQHRIEVALRHLDGQIYLSNSPGPRDWAANLLAKPELTYHLKQSAQIDVAARATPITDVDEKRKLLTDILAKEDHLDQLEARMEGSHLFRVEVLGSSANA